MRVSSFFVLTALGLLFWFVFISGDGEDVQHRWRYTQGKTDGIKSGIASEIASETAQQKLERAERYFEAHEGEIARDPSARRAYLYQLMDAYCTAPEGPTEDLLYRRIESSALCVITPRTAPAVGAGRSQPARTSAASASSNG